MPPSVLAGRLRQPEVELAVRGPLHQDPPVGGFREEAADRPVLEVAEGPDLREQVDRQADPDPFLTFLALDVRLRTR
jgi:hypothetical protein